MKVLMLSTDKKIFEKGSGARNRISQYGRIFDELNILIYTHRRESVRDEVIGSRVFAYASNSLAKIFFIFDVIRLIHVHKIKADILTSMDPFELGLIAWMVARIYGIKLHFQVHTDVFNVFYRNKSLRCRLQYYLSKFLLPRADGIRVISEKVKEDIAKEFPGIIGKVRILPLFSEVTIKDDKLSPDENPVVLVVSRFSHEKNVPAAVKIFAMIKDKVPAAKLVILGEGPERSMVEEEIKRNKLEDSVEIVPWQSNVQPYYDSSSLLLHPSFFEGFSMVHLEASAAGLPIVSSDSGVFVSMPDDIKEMCVCSPDDLGCFAQKSTAFLTSVNDRQAFFKKVRPQIVKQAIIDFDQYLKSYRHDMEETLKK